MSLVKCHNLINGSWVTGEGGTQIVHSPYNNFLLGEYSIPSSAQIDTAIKAASVAQKKWAELPIKERSKILFTFRNILLENQDEISSLKCAESGKTLAEAKAGL